MANLVPTQEMANAVKRGLEMRASVSLSEKCCFESTIQRARKIMNRDELTSSHVRRMYSFFSRHEVDKESEEWKINPNSKSRQAWLIWGGDPGYSWSKRKVAELEREKAKDIKEFFISLFK